MQLPLSLILHFALGFWAVSVWASKAPSGAITAAVNTAYNLNVRNVETQNQPIKPQKIDIESNTLPLVLHFKSSSSKLKIMQSHRGNEGEVHKSLSEDDPDILMHEVRKPIIQHIRELIIPIRKTTQEVKPVVEHIETIVSGSKDNANSNAVETAYTVKAKATSATLNQNQNQNQAMSNSAPFDNTVFPDENFLRNRLNEQAANRNNGIRNGQEMPNGDGSMDGNNSFNQWIHSFKNDQPPMGNNNNRNY